MLLVFDIKGTVLTIFPLVGFHFFFLVSYKLQEGTSKHKLLKKIKRFSDTHKL